MTRPFEVDDYIESVGISGTVEEIHVINTRLRTPDNKVVFIPNGQLSASTIINYSTKEKRRVDILFKIPSDKDIRLVKEIIKSTAASHPLVIPDPEISVIIKAHGNKILPISLRAWVSSEDYWTVFYDLTEEVGEALNDAGICASADCLSVEIQ